MIQQINRTKHAKWNARLQERIINPTSNEHREHGQSVVIAPEAVPYGQEAHASGGSGGITECINAGLLPPADPSCS
jgi:hypothetical protein